MDYIQTIYSINCRCNIVHHPILIRREKSPDTLFEPDMCPVLIGSLILIGQDIPCTIILSDGIILLAHRVIAQILVSGHKESGMLRRGLALLPGKQITSLGAAAITAREVEFPIVRHAALDLDDVDAVRPVGCGDALVVCAQAARLRVELVLDESDGNGVVVVVDFAVAHEFADHEGVRGVAAVERYPGEAEGGVGAGGPFVPASIVRKSTYTGFYSGGLTGLGAGHICIH